jgi:hypothetical protein
LPDSRSALYEQGIKRPRRHVHLTPIGVSWINQVERFFTLLTERQSRLPPSPNALGRTCRERYNWGAFQLVQAKL